jgi:hypothetical protein
MYARGAYADKQVVGAVKGEVAALARRHGIADRRRVRVEPPKDLPIGALVPAPGQLTLLPA